MKGTLWAFLIACTISAVVSAQTEVFEFRTYELEFFRSSDILHDYFKQALIPALNRQGLGE